MKKIFLLATITLTCLHSFSQSCEVTVPALQGKYTGDCKKNKADGKGKAEGTDTYEGDFKNGLPSGEGTYTYHNGDYFTGVFKKGVKEGKGEMHYKKTDAADSIIKGFWKNDAYAGEYLQPYELSKVSSGFARLDVKTDVSTANTITFVSQNTIKMNSLSGGVPPTPEISFFAVDEGSYERDEKFIKNKISTLILYQVKFPIHLRINYESDSYELTIYKPGSWRIFAEMNTRD